MSKIYHISKTNILEEVLNKIQGAQKSIFVTNLDTNGEIPKEFLTLVAQKKQSGILFQRISFAKKKEESDILIKNPQEYQRMILIDEKKLFWGTDKKELQLFFYTENTQIVKKFSKYFRSLQNNH